MKRQPITEDPKYWRARAEEARAMAESFASPNTKALLFGIAESYEKLAEAAEHIAEMNRDRAAND